MNWNQMWLNYRPGAAGETAGRFFQSVYCRETAEICRSAVGELGRFAEKTFGISMSYANHPESAGICLILKEESARSEDSRGADGFEIHGSPESICITAYSPSGLLYGTFELIRLVMQGENPEGIHTKQRPEFRYRMLNHWDDMDGHIERGYSGRSFFFRDGRVLHTERLKDYARLIASVGINQTVINNVNVRDGAEFLISEKYLEDVREYAELFGRYGIRLFLSVDFASPVTVGGLKTADPLCAEVRQWWRTCAERIYRMIPDFGGFLVKADSEGRPGPYYYGRDHADGANMLAEALAPYGGRVIWRCFVYNCRQDWRDRSVDRAKAAYDTFFPLDGRFDPNVILQIKSGPMDFQVREPVSPLFGKMKNTCQMLEVQIAQEYTGQQVDVCFLVPVWKEILSFQTACSGTNDTVADIISGKTFGNAECGIAGVANTGGDENWTGNDLAAANLYGFGRLAWDSSLSSRQIAEEWCRCTFGPDPLVLKNAAEILMMSRETYEKYTTPFGLGWMVTPHTHYGPSPEGYEYDVWGTYHRADHEAVGIERGPEGTGFALQYHPENAAVYGDPKTCPEELLLFFHRVRYNTKMKNGKTLLQNLYDLHFEGAEEVGKMISLWEEMKGKLPEEVYGRVRSRFSAQQKNSEEWRDVVNTYFYRLTLTGDEQKRTIYD